MNETLSCPVSDTDEQSTNILQESSQRILDHHDDIDEILDDTQSTLRTLYALMLEYNPQRAEVAIARKMRSVSRGALGAIIIGRMAELLLPHSQGMERRAFIDHIDSYAYDYSTAYMNGQYCGPADTWMTIMLHLKDESYPPSFPDSLDNSVLQSIEQASPRLYKALADAYAAINDPREHYWRKRTFIFDSHHAGRENIIGVFDAILAGYIAITKSGEVDVEYADSVAAALIANIKSLTRFASMNKSTFAKALPDAHGSQPPQQIFAAKGSDLGRLEDVFTYQDGKLIPSHRSITDGPWRKPGNCGGLSWLRINDQHTLGSVARHAHELGTTGLDKLGRMRAVETLMRIGIDLGSYTILQAAESPVILRYGRHQAQRSRLHR